MSLLKPDDLHSDCEISQLVKSDDCLNILFVFLIFVPSIFIVWPCLNNFGIVCNIKFCISKKWFIIIHHLLFDRGHCVRGAVICWIMRPSFFAAGYDSASFKKLIPCKGYLLSTAPLTLSCVSWSSLIRVHRPQCWRGGAEDWGMTDKTDEEMRNGLLPEIWIVSGP